MCCRKSVCGHWSHHDRGHLLSVEVTHLIHKVVSASGYLAGVSLTQGLRESSTGLNAWLGCWLLHTMDVNRDNGPGTCTGQLSMYLGASCYTIRHLGYSKDISISFSPIGSSDTEYNWVLAIQETNYHALLWCTSVEVISF